MNRLRIVVAVACMSLAVAASGQATRAATAGKTRTYYLAAEETIWDYAPGGRDLTMDMAFDDDAKTFVERSADRIGSKYKKAVFVEYTDGAFKQRKPRPQTGQHLGILGPILHAQVGDKIRVVFRNKASRPYSIHPHGVFYTKANEGALTNDGTSDAEHAGSAVAPDATYVYEWSVPSRAGPGPSDPSSVVWPYHSHVDSVRDMNSGLVGAIIVTAAGAANADGSPAGVDREFVTLFDIFDETNPGIWTTTLPGFPANRLVLIVRMPASSNPTTSIRSTDTFSAACRCRP